MQQQRGRKESVDMNVERVGPFYVLFELVRTKQTVDEQPHEGGHDCAH